MTSIASKSLSLFLVFLILFSAQANISASPVLSSSELRQAAVDHTRSRQEAVDRIEQFLSRTEAMEAMKAMNADPDQVTKAVPLLSDDELTRISAQIGQMEQSTFAAGYHGDDIVFLLIVVLVIVAAVVIAIEVTD